MFSTMTTAPSTTMPKSSAPRERRLAGILLKSSQMAAKSREKGMVSATINAARALPKNKNKMIVTKIMPSARLCSTVCRVKMEQVGAVQHRNDLHALGQDVLVELLDLRVNRIQGRPLPSPHPCLVH